MRLTQRLSVCLLAGCFIPLPAAAQVQQRSMNCHTRRHSAQLRWHRGYARMTFTTKPNTTILNNAAPVMVRTRADGSITYTVPRETTVSVTVYPNQTCELRTIDAKGKSTLQEMGQVRN
jgi:hypothetical protein